MQQDNQPQVYLTNPTRTLALRLGDVIDGQWRIEKVDSTAVHLTWLPGALPQRIEYATPR